jgi:hypothetical protein
MSAPSRGRTTLVDLAIVAARGLALSALWISCIARPTRHGALPACSDNLRNINLALFQYCVSSDEHLPATSFDVFRCLGVHMGDATDKDFAGDVWRCPGDRLIPRAYAVYWYSYVPAADAIVRDKSYTCFVRNAAIENRLPNIAPDTISWMEGGSATVFGGQSGSVLSLRCLDMDCRDTEYLDAQGIPRAAPKCRDPKFPNDRGAATDKGDDVALTDAFGTRRFTAENERSRLPPGTDAGVGEYRFMLGYCAAYAARFASATPTTTAASTSPTLMAA